MQQTNKYVESHKTFVKKGSSIAKQKWHLHEETLPSLVVPNFPTNTDQNQKRH